MHRRLSLAVLLLSASLCGMEGEESEAKEGHQRVAEALRTRSLDSLQETPKKRKTKAKGRRSASLPVHPCMRGETSERNAPSSPGLCLTGEPIYASQFPGRSFVSKD